VAKMKELKSQSFRSFYTFSMGGAAEENFFLVQLGFKILPNSGISGRFYRALYLDVAHLLIYFPANEERSSKAK